MLKEGAKHVEDGGKLITIVTALLAAFTGYYTSCVNISICKEFPTDLRIVMQERKHRWKISRAA